MSDNDQSSFGKDQNLQSQHGQPKSGYGILSLVGIGIGWFFTTLYSPAVITNRSGNELANRSDNSLKGSSNSSGSALNLTTPQFRDKLRGMLLLGGYGDALGAPHETNGIKGNAGDPGGERGRSSLIELT